ncbi:MAG: hypothetical protein ACD_8C00027G0001 [uncultured bacterium]|nr:MAG: hypothetical protein ACD_8C00027G0001 [uncultured bacterium]
MFYFMNEFITTSSAQTKKIGAMLAEELCGGEIICLSGDLGAGKTTFTQGLLKGLKIKGPYTSPTFSIIKHYRKEFPISKSQFPKKSKNSKSQTRNIYHIDAYRINSKDLLELGFKDFAGKPNSITIIEWPEKVKKIIPTTALWIHFECLSDKERKIVLSIKK